LTWHQSTVITNECTGYFQDSTGTAKAVGIYASNTARYIQPSSLILFTAPDGYYFDENNQLHAGVPTAPGQHLTIWASPTAVYLNGTAQGLGNLPSGVGPVVLNTFVPTGAIPLLVIPVLVTDLGTTLEQEIVNQIYLNQNFGLGYTSVGVYDKNNNLVYPAQSWYLITATNLAVNATYSTNGAGDTSGTNQDASWFIQCTTNGTNYTVESRSLNYYFGSVAQTRFFFYSNQPIYDSRTGTVVRDFVNVLKINSRPDSNYPLPGDNILNIIDQPVLSDGLTDDFQVEVSFSYGYGEAIPSNPDFFNDIVAPSVNPTTKLVFFQQTVDFDNLQRYLMLNQGVVNSDFPTQSAILLSLTQYNIGQVFYAYTEQVFYVLTVNSSGNQTLTVDNSYLALTGRQDLYFQYRHNSPLSSRIDPGSTNIIDVYVVTNEYYTAYNNWLKDTTGTVTEPTPPTINDLTTTYSTLQDYKMISDNMILNSVEFQPLFGQTADAALRATIKVIRSTQSTASTSEITNLVVANMDAYFNLAAWDFGQTFYFSELAAYIHQNIGDVVSSVVLVPLDPQKSFGDLYEIRCAPNQIFVNGATVNDIEVITALTSNNLQTASGSGVI
jgi:hypothetical protein